jgi:hypothetical protein
MPGLFGKGGMMMMGCGAEGAGGASHASSLLQEDGASFLLQEDGTSKILQE